MRFMEQQRTLTYNESQAIFLTKIEIV
jgi:hypothetical protein